MWPPFSETTQTRAETRSSTSVTTGLNCSERLQDQTVLNEDSENVYKGNLLSTV